MSQITWYCNSFKVLPARSFSPQPIRLKFCLTANLWCLGEIEMLFPQNAFLRQKIKEKDFTETVKWPPKPRENHSLPQQPSPTTNVGLGGEVLLIPQCCAGHFFVAGCSWGETAASRNMCFLLCMCLLLQLESFLKNI